MLRLSEDKASMKQEARHCKEPGDNLKGEMNKGKVHSSLLIWYNFVHYVAVALDRTLALC